MIKVKNKCGIYHFEFDSNYEEDHLRLVLGEFKNGYPILQYWLIESVKYTINGTDFLNKDINYYLYNLLQPLPRSIATYCGIITDLLEKNNLAFNITTNKIVNSNTLLNQQINVNDKVMGLLQNNSKIKSWSGYYDIDNNISIVREYETY